MISSELPPLVRLRQMSMRPDGFGKAAGAKKSEQDADLVAIENSIAIQLGSVDPIAKAAIDEITSLMQASQQIQVQSATAKRMRAKAAELDARDAAAAAAASSSGAKPQSAPAALTAEEKKGLTWDEARRLKQEQSAAAGGQGRQGRPTGPADKSADGGKQRRTASGNLIDPLVVRVRNLPDITPAELQRIFGPDNNLGVIQRAFIAGGDKGLAYITYKSELDATAAIQQMNGKRFKFCLLHVDHGTKRGGK